MQDISKKLLKFGVYMFLMLVGYILHPLLFLSDVTQAPQSATSIGGVPLAFADAPPLPGNGGYGGESNEGDDSSDADADGCGDCGDGGGDGDGGDGGDSG